MKKKLPIGISDFEDIIQGDYYYVDKSLLIKEIIDTGAAVTLIPRPRRFGKTLNLSMLKHFFESVQQSQLDLFTHLKINQYPDIMKHQGVYPVVYLTFKDIKSDTWDSCYESIKQLLSKEYERHIYLTQDAFLSEIEKRNFNSVIDLTGTQTTYENSLKNLTEYLYRHHKKKPLILIDEYDTPIHTGFNYKYYENIIIFMRGFLGSALKDNTNMKFGVITGILRIAKESVFSGLNNLDVCTLLNSAYADKFGLLENEVKTILSAYGLEKNLDEVRSWYNGYTSGDYMVYNPWSIINLIRNHGLLQPYWVNTSDNILIKELIQHGNEGLKEDFELLLAKKSITKEITENIVFQEIRTNENALWNFLLLCGYLTYHNKVFRDKKIYADLTIPNIEIESFFESTILSWFEQSLGIRDYVMMLQSLTSGDMSTFIELFHDFVMKSFSAFDVSGKEPEKFYHAFVLGMLVSLGKDYIVKSNRESGYGRYDVMLIPYDKKKNGIIIEFKKVRISIKETIEQAAANALEQIETKQYAQELYAQGVTRIFKLGIAFEGKNVLILEGT